MAMQRKKKSGFTLVENIVAVAIFALLAGVIYQTSALLIRSVGAYRENTTISSLADQYMEIVHNLPYSSVGTLSGNPHGSLPDEPNSSSVMVSGSNYKVYYVVNYIDDTADGTARAGTDFASNDYKQVKLYVQNASTKKTYSFSTNITPRGLENLDSGGALVISVIDARGVPVPNAVINIKNTTISPNINLTRTADGSGNWIEVGLPNSANSYHITATKSGYSTDQTYPISGTNPNPTKPDSTIVNGQITQVSLAIDKLSSLSFETLNQSCNIISGIGMKVVGEKLIGNPSLLKFDHTYNSDSLGKISLGSIEWDNYTPTLTGSSYMVYGSSPIQQVSVLPDTEQNYTLLLGPKTTNSLLVIVKDSSTGDPIEGATVELKKSSPNVDESKITGGSIWSTFSWLENGEDQGDNVSTEIMPYALRLLSYDNGASYVSNGALISAIFDTDNASTTYSTLNWQPTSQDPETEIKFQIATNNQNTSTTTWNFIGPDGTNGSFYTSSGSNINNSAARYIRYKVLLSTTNPEKTPVLTKVNINYVPGCFTPGQVFFPNLSSGTNYSLTISAQNYVSQTINNLEIAGYKVSEILLSK
jgi:prepilin-type N-terminal cleavage/methylation domain-containing protein